MQVIQIDVVCLQALQGGEAGLTDGLAAAVHAPLAILAHDPALCGKHELVPLAFDSLACNIATCAMGIAPKKGEQLLHMSNITLICNRQMLVSTAGV